MTGYAFAFRALLTTFGPMVTIYGPEADPEPLSAVSDLAGTPVVDVESDQIGSVFGALAEVESGLLRYLDVALDDVPKHILIPIGHARVDRAEGGAQVRLRAATRDDLQGVPTYDPEADGVDEPFEREVLSSLGRLFYGERYYAHPAYDHSGLYAGEHPLVRADEEKALPGQSTLVALRELRGYRVADGVPDVRGWRVVTGDGTDAGDVADLVVDVKEETVRYIIIGDDGAADATAMLPVGYARIDKRNQRIELPVLTPADVQALRFLEPGQDIDRAAEQRVRTTIEEALSGSRRFDRVDFATSVADEEDDPRASEG